MIINLPSKWAQLTWKILFEGLLNGGFRTTPLAKDFERSFLVSYPSQVSLNSLSIQVYSSLIFSFLTIERRGLSPRSIRRFCKERNIDVTTLRWISDEYLEEMVTSNIMQVKLNFVIIEAKLETKGPNVHCIHVSECQMSHSYWMQHFWREILWQLALFVAGIRMPTDVKANWRLHIFLRDNIMHRSIWKFNIPRGQTPGHLNFWRLARSNSCPSGPKLCSNALPLSAGFDCQMPLPKSNFF